MSITADNGSVTLSYCSDDSNYDPGSGHTFKLHSALTRNGSYQLVASIVNDVPSLTGQSSRRPCRSHTFSGQTLNRWYQGEGGITVDNDDWATSRKVCMGTCVTPTPTPTNTPVTPSPTPANTPVTPSPTPTNTPVTPSPTPVTPSPTPITPSPTNTPVTPTPTVTARMTIILHKNSPGVTLIYDSPNAEEQHTFQLLRSRTQGGTYSVYKSGIVTPEVGLPHGLQATGGASGAAVRGASVSGWVSYQFSSIDRGWWYKGYGGRTGRSWMYSSAVHLPFNIPPTISGPSSPSYAENRTDAVATYTATDRNRDPVTLLLRGDDAAQFRLGGNGNLTFKTTPNFEAPPTGGRNNVHGVVYDLIVQANDGKDTTNKSITVTLTDVNEPPGKPAVPTVTAGSQTKTSLLVTWSTPTVNTGPDINDYDVQYRVSGSGPFADAGYDGKATETTITGLSANTTYQVQVRAKNNEGNSPWSESGKGKTSPLPQLTTPTGLDVRPLLPYLMANFSWSPVPNANRYVVEIRKHGETAETAWSPLPSRPETSYPTYLDDILSGKGLGDDPYAYQFRVKATNSSGSYQDSGYSETITVVDNPVLANGHSPGIGQAVVKWRPINDATSYTIQYRKLEGDHSYDKWFPQYDLAEDWRDVAVGSGSTQYTITPLQLGAIYAIQFNYTVSGHKFFSGRNAYVWPSGQAPQPGDRVATFPMNHPLTDNTYEYRICENTFPAGQRTRWSNLIKHAFEQWELATVLEGGSEPLITMTYIDGPCADYTPFIDKIAHEVTQYLSNPDPDAVRKIVEGLLIEFRNRRIISPTLPDVQNRDEALNEVLMFDDVAGSENVLLEVGAFPEFSEDLGYPQCSYEDLGCAQRTPFGSGHTTDIFIRHSPIRDDPLVVPQDVHFSKCPNGYYDTLGTNAYEILLHEAGHAIGIREAHSGNDLSHPSNYSQIHTVMNTDYTESDCSLHPFDIMAIHALYQSR